MIAHVLLNLFKELGNRDKMRGLPSILSLFATSLINSIFTRQQEDKQSKAVSSLFSIEMIAKQEWTQSNAHQNIEQLQNPTMGVTINNDSTTTELC